MMRVNILHITATLFDITITISCKRGIITSKNNCSYGPDDIMISLRQRERQKKQEMFPVGGKKSELHSEGDVRCKIF